VKMGDPGSHCLVATQRWMDRERQIDGKTERHFKSILPSTPKTSKVASLLQVFHLTFSEQFLAFPCVLHASPTSASLTLPF
jgi:hypothetical protein